MMMLTNIANKIMPLQRRNMPSYMLLRTASCVLIASALLLQGCTSLTPMQAETSRLASNPNIYIVKNGDTLGGIAKRYHQDYRVLARLNNLDGNYSILAGQALRLNSAAPQTAQSQAAPNNRNTPSNTPPKTTMPPTTTVNSIPVVSPQATPVWQWPVKGSVLQKMDLNAGIKGIYIGGRVGDIVKAAADGDVVYADNKLKGYGNLILIRHANNYITAYAHSSQMLVSGGAHVQAGQAIGIMGIAKLDQPMIEFQLRLKGNPQDPLLLLPQLTQ